MTEDIHEIISQKFPGVELESPIQGWVYLEEYEKGIEAHQAIIQAHTKAQDDRWLGVCYFQLFNDMKALELFYRSVARGSEGARINLALAFYFVERKSEMLAELNKVNFYSLKPYDQALFFRVKSYYEEDNGKLQDALNDAEKAWAIIQNLAELPVLAPQILNQIGILHARVGRAQRALWFIERSLELASDLEKLKGYIRRAYLLIILGRYDEALKELKRPELSSAPNYSQEVHLRIGEALWAKCDIDNAISHYEESVTLSLEKELGYEEFQSRLALAAILGFQGFTATAGEHLARAKVLISDYSDQLSYNLREILTFGLTGEYSVKETLTKLYALSKQFRDTGLLQEQGWVKLHIAEMHRKSANEKAITDELDALQRLATTLQNNNFLAREWTLVPELHKLAAKTHPKIAGKSPDVLELYTMGEEKLVLNGKVVNVRMKKAIEIIAYFLEHGKVSLKKMLLDIFPDEDPKKARNYFHQFKHELRERLPGLSLEYNNEERLYALKTDFDIMWDVAELRAGRKMGALGIFLLGSGNEWAEMLEHKLAPLKETDKVFQVAEASAA